MEKRQPLLRLRKDELGNQGIVLFEEDLFIMRQLVIHQTLRSVNIHELFQCQSATERNPNSITNRIGKLRMSGLLVALKEKPIDVRGALFIYHYKLGSRGVDTLVELGELSSEEGERMKYVLHNIRVAPTKHKRCVSHVATHSFIRSYKSGLMQGAFHERGSTHPLFTSSKVQNKGNMPEIIPDWIFEKESTVACIEMDTGSQSMEVLLMKCKRYIRQAKKVQEQGKQLIVIFSVADDSVPGDYSANRERRVGAIKEIIPSFLEWPSNLNFYVVSAKRTPPLIERLLGFIEPYTVEDRLLYAEDWSDKAELVVERSCEFTPVRMEQYFGTNRNTSADCQLLVAVRTKMRNAQRNLYAVISGEEGSVWTFQLIRANAARSLEVSAVPGAEQMRVLVCYAEQESAAEEVYLQNSTASISFTDLDSWVRAMNEGTEPPQVNTFVSRMATERRAFNV